MVYHYAMFYSQDREGKLYEALGSDSYLPLDARFARWRQIDKARDHAKSLNEQLNKRYKAFQIRSGNRYRPFSNYSKLTPVMEL